MKVRVLSSAPIFLKNNSVRDYPFSSRSSLSVSFSQNRLADVSGMRVSKSTNHGNVRWRATASLNGKRRQRFFTSRDDARAWLDSIRTDHTGFWNGRTAEEQGEIVSAFKLASERRLSLQECVLSNNINGKPLPITDAINRYINVISQRSLRPNSIGIYGVQALASSHKQSVPFSSSKAKICASLRKQNLAYPIPIWSKYVYTIIAFTNPAST